MRRVLCFLGLHNLRQCARCAAEGRGIRECVWCGKLRNWSRTEGQWD